MSGKKKSGNKKASATEILILVTAILNLIKVLIEMISKLVE